MARVRLWQQQLISCGHMPNSFQMNESFTGFDRRPEKADNADQTAWKGREAIPSSRERQSKINDAKNHTHANGRRNVWHRRTWKTKILNTFFFSEKQPKRLCSNGSSQFIVLLHVWWVILKRLEVRGPKTLRPGTSQNDMEFSAIN